MHRLTLLHPIDPRGSKVGGIETHVRLMYERRPADFSVLLVGIDERGDLELGKPVRLPAGDGTIDFLPVAHIPDAEIHSAAKRLHQSVTLRFALGALRHLGTIRRRGGDDRTAALRVRGDRPDDRPSGSADRPWRRQPQGPDGFADPPVLVPESRQ